MNFISQRRRGAVQVLALVLGLTAVAVSTSPALARTADTDGDGLTDFFEEALVRRFFPNLWVTNLQDRNAFYGCITSDPWAKVPFMVEPVWYSASFASGLACLYPDDCLLLKIGLAYDRDFGDNVFGGGHRGDSEFYYALLSRVNFQRSLTKTSSSGATCTASVAKTDASCWWLMVDWTSAHSGEPFDSSHHAVISPLLSTIGDQDAGIVYSATGKHANYHLDDECGDGGVPIFPWNATDDCKPKYNIRDTCFLKFQNIGNTPTFGGDGQGDGFNRYIRYPESSVSRYDMWSFADFANSSPYRPKFEDRNGTELWSYWYSCIFAGSAIDKFAYCWRFDVACTSNDSCTCYDSCSPNQAYLACGNGVCSPGESCSSCSQDCGSCPPVCGNGLCESGESCSSCKFDCGACPSTPTCGNGLCESGETCETSGGTGECQPDCGCCEGWQPVCFVAGTPVTLADGSTRPIEQLLVGDRVLAYDEERGVTVPSRITRTFVHTEVRQALVRINGALTATGNHPFYVVGRDEPVRADELAIGDRLFVLDGPATGRGRAPETPRRLQVRSLELLPSVGTVYNIEVAGRHNYFAGGVLVHNKTATGGCEPSDGGPAF